MFDVHVRYLYRFWDSQKAGWEVLEPVTGYSKSVM